MMPFVVDIMTSLAPPLMGLLMGLFGTTCNHLLDYASTDAYWKDKKVAISLEAMVKEATLGASNEDVSILLKALGSADPQVRQQAAQTLMQKGTGALPQLQEAASGPDPETAAGASGIIEHMGPAAKAAAVRRLMALRALGELKKQEALPVLRALIGSKTMFVAEYAQRAIAGLEGRKYAGEAVALAQRMPANMMTKADTLEGATEGIVIAAEKVGDIRLDMATVAVAGEIGPNVGWATVVFRGQYDAAAGRASLRKARIKSRKVGEIEVFSWDDHVALMCPSNDCVVFIVGARTEVLPVEAMVQAMTTGRGTLPNNKEMVKLIESIDITQPAWAVMKVTDTYRQAEWVRGFDTITAVLTQNNDVASVDVKGEGVNAKQVADSVNYLNTQVQNSSIVLKLMVARTPAIKPVLDALESVKCIASDKGASLTGSMKMDAPGIVGGVMGIIVDVIPKTLTTAPTGPAAVKQR